MKLLPISWIILFLWSAVACSATVTLRDEVGRQVTFPYPPKRVVSLAPNLTEILFSLGLDEEIVGVSIHCNFPEKAGSRPRVGSYIHLDYEKVLSLRPELIIATGAGNTREMVDRLERWGIPAYVVFPKNFNGVLESIRRVGEVVGREKEAASLSQTMDRRREKVSRLTRGLRRPKVFLQIGELPIVTVGRGSFGDDLIRLAGGMNLAGDERLMYPRWSVEEVLRRSPEVIVVSSMNPQGDYQRILQDWDRRKGIPAVRDHRVHLIDSDLIDRPSPRLIDGLEQMARFLHPDLFKE